MAFPAFSEYHDTFASPLPAPTFEAYTIPSWIPNPANLIRIARAVYPYWKERRIERGGHRIIPVLNVSLFLKELDQPYLTCIYLG
jgi:enhancer of polycomb-like protein